MNININLKKGKHLNYQDKLKIEGFLANKNILGYEDGYATEKIIKNTKKRLLKNIKELAEYIGRSPKTIKRELKRGSVSQIDEYNRIYYAYSADASHKRYKKIRKMDTRVLKIDNDLELFNFIASLLKKKYSPYACIQIAIKNGYEPTMTPRTLLNYIRMGLFESVGIKSDYSVYKLKTKKKNKYPKLIRKGTYNSIEDRPETINNRIEKGNWEIDTVAGPRVGKNKALLVLTERYSRYQIIKVIKRKKSKYVIGAIKKILLSRKDLIFKTITSDNGSEFYEVNKFCEDKGITWYYCHPYCSGERGSNENNNKFIRRFIPKGTKIEKYTIKDIIEIENYMNNYPRKIFNGKSSKEIYFKEEKTA